MISKQGGIPGLLAMAMLVLLNTMTVSQGTKRSSHAGVRSKYPQQRVISLYRLPIRYAAMAFSPDGRTLYAGSSDIMAFRVSDGRRIWKRSDYYVIQCAVSPRGRLLATVGHFKHKPAPKTDERLYRYERNRITLWDLRSHKAVKTFGKDCESIAFSPDETKVVVGGGGDVMIYKVPSGRMVYRLSDVGGSIHYTAFSPNSRQFALLSTAGDTGYTDGLVFDLHASPRQNGVGGEGYIESNGMMGGPLFFLARGRYVVVGNSLLDLHRRHPTFQRLLPLKNRQCVGAFPPRKDAALFLTGSYLEVWDVIHKKRLYQWTGLPDITSLYGKERLSERIAISRDGKTLAYSDDVSVRLYRLPTVPTATSLHGR